MIHTTRQSLRVEKDESISPKPCIFRFLNANKNVVAVTPLRKMTPQTTESSNCDEITHGAQQNSSYFSLIILACKEIHNGVFAPMAGNTLGKNIH